MEEQCINKTGRRVKVYVYVRSREVDVNGRSSRRQHTIASSSCSSDECLREACKAARTSGRERMARLSLQSACRGDRFVACRRSKERGSPQLVKFRVRPQKKNMPRAGKPQDCSSCHDTVFWLNICALEWIASRLVCTPLNFKRSQLTWDERHLASIKLAATAQHARYTSGSAATLSKGRKSATGHLLTTSAAVHHGLSESVRVLLGHTEARSV